MYCILHAHTGYFFMYASQKLNEAFSDFQKLQKTTKFNILLSSN